jgi:hypothetical protein
VVPLRAGQITLAMAQRVAGTASLSEVEIVISDGCRVVEARQAAALLTLRGRTLEVQCRGADARRVARLVAQHLRGVRGALGPGSGRW